MSLEVSVQYLLDWYANNCNGDWGHEYGIKISTIDNPGWLIQVNLSETDISGRVMEPCTWEPEHGRWVRSWSNGEEFNVVCDVHSFDVAIGEFQKFAEAK